MSNVLSGWWKMADIVRCLFCAKPLGDGDGTGETQIVEVNSKNMIRWWCSYYHRDLWVKARRIDPSSPGPRARADDRGGREA